MIPCTLLCTDQVVARWMFASVGCATWKSDVRVSDVCTCRTWFTEARTPVGSGVPPGPLTWTY